MKDIEIARSIKPLPITEIADKLGVAEKYLEPYGRYKAKITLEPDKSPKGKLILVTATSPTPLGEGKTTVSVGLADGLRRIGKKSCLTLREPSLGPVFGVKGGAAGGGCSQVIPMEDINLHFTGDFHAITTANNLLSALIDNHIKQGNVLNLDPSSIEWRRCMDLNDRALREIEAALGGEANGLPRKDGFVITAASEIMAVLCLSEGLEDLKERLNRIIVGYTYGNKAVTVRDLNAADAMAILLKDAVYPNLVQTLEGTPAIIHGGPFANIAHGCNSVRATKLAMSLADYTVTEAGFGADLGAEKFIDIKCRTAGIRPSAAVLVTSVRALKYNGGGESNPGALTNGLVNLTGHLENMTKKYRLKTVVAVNRFPSDTEDEQHMIEDAARRAGVTAVTVECYEKGGLGCQKLAEEVTKLAETRDNNFSYLYPDAMPLSEKIETVAEEIYKAGRVVYSGSAAKKLEAAEREGYGVFPVCVAKTQFSFSDDPKNLGRPTGFDLHVRDISVKAGAGFVVVICGNILLMPGLPAFPAAQKMFIDSDGKIDGLF